MQSHGADILGSSIKSGRPIHYEKVGKRGKGGGGVEGGGGIILITTFSNGIIHSFFLILLFNSFRRSGGAAVYPPFNLSLHIILFPLLATAGKKLEALTVRP